MAKRTTFRIAPFEVDITPPVGHPLAFVVNRKIDSAIHVRGLVLDDGNTRAVLAAAEIIGLSLGAYHQWKRCLARAAGCHARQVLIHSVHQHDSIRPPCPLVDAELRKRGLGVRPEAQDDYWKSILERLKAAIGRAIRAGRAGRWRNVTGLATAERRLSGLAANRRLVGERGRVVAMRWSMTSDPKLQRWPAGCIDPCLRTIAFLGAGGRLLASTHFYASHPMGAYRRNMVSADIPGVALEHLRRALKNRGLHMYFTGCAGNVTFGKYTFASKTKNLRVLGKRLGEALAANVDSLEERACGPLCFMRSRLAAPRDTRKFNRASVMARLKAARTREQAEPSAGRLVLLRNWKTWGRPWLARMSIGPDVQLLSLPAETAVEYQLYAQALVPERFLAVAAYGDGTLGYISTAQMFKEGGYEPGASVSTPAVEARYKQAIERLLKDLR